MPILRNRRTAFGSRAGFVYILIHTKMTIAALIKSANMMGTSLIYFSHTGNPMSVCDFRINLVTAHVGVRDSFPFLFVANSMSQHTIDFP